MIDWTEGSDPVEVKGPPSSPEGGLVAWFASVSLSLRCVPSAYHFSFHFNFLCYSIRVIIRPFPNSESSVPPRLKGDRCAQPKGERLRAWRFLSYLDGRVFLNKAHGYYIIRIGLRCTDMGLSKWATFL